MRQSVFKLVVRNLLRQKLHSSINIIGFAIGIAVFVIIVRYVNHQLSFDKFHSKHTQIYKVCVGKNQILPPATANFLKKNIAAIEDYVRLDNWYGGNSGWFKITGGDATIKVDNLIYADSNLFEFFDFQLLRGNYKEALKEPNSIILTESYALKIFGNNNPVGKGIEFILASPQVKLNYTVFGVIKDPPLNSSIQFNGLISLSTIPFNAIRRSNIDSDWSNWAYSTYVKISDPTVVDELNAELPEFWVKKVAARYGAEPGSKLANEYKLAFVPLKDVHFYKNNKRMFIYLILLIGLMILVVVVINYINLSLAISTTRGKEIGIRKVTGSRKFNLFFQLISESIIITFISAILAILIIYIIQPLLVDITGFKTMVEPGSVLKTWIFFILGVMLIGFLSGIYPAYNLTRLRPVKILKNEIVKGKNASTLKHVLVVVQFVISIFLVIGVLSVSKQMRYMKSKDLGFDKEHIIYFTGSSIDNKYHVFKETLLRNVNISGVTRTNQTFGCPLGMGGRYKVNGENKRFLGTTVDPSFIETFGIDLIEGRNFSWDNKNYNTALVNECFVKEMGLSQPIGTVVKFRGRKISIIGVIKNFHNNSFHYAIEPSVYWYGPMNVVVHVKVNNTNIGNTIVDIEKTWNEFAPDMPFDYSFLDEIFDKLYKADIEFQYLIQVFTILAIFIACFGLFGLISFNANQRKKEIGIRKINGAKIVEIVSMLNQDIIKWIFIAFVFACPLAYLAMNKWLVNFAYRTQLSWWIFALAGGIALLIAILTVSWQSWRAARRNPVEALRYE